MKVGKKELYLLLALLGVGIAVLAWQFGFNKLNVKTEALRVETEALQSEITKYTAVKDNIALYTTGIENATNSIADVLHKFPVAILEEDMIMLGRQLEKKIDGTYVSNVSFGGASNIYVATSRPVEPTSVPLSYSLYNNNINISYETSYKGFKEIMDYINENKDRMSVNNFSLSYDTETGLVAGTTSINMYSVTGTDKQYTQQNLSGVGLGTDNIFGTLD